MWWLTFNDRTLNDLQAQVDAANPDLAAAVAANDEAVARANAALSASYPQVDANPHFLANKQSANRPLRSAGQPTYFGDNLLGAQVAYEVDIWGRVRDLVHSANATAEASADALADARLELHAELARDYVNLRGLDEEAKLFADTIAIYRSALKLTQDRLAANIASPVDVDRAQTQLSSAEAQSSDLTLNRATLENSIAALVGKAAAVIFGLAVFEATSLAKTAARGAGRRVAQSSGRRGKRTADRRGERADRRIARQFFSQAHFARARRNPGHQIQALRSEKPVRDRRAVNRHSLVRRRTAAGGTRDRQGAIH